MAEKANEKSTFRQQRLNICRTRGTRCRDVTVCQARNYLRTGGKPDAQSAPWPAASARGLDFCGFSPTASLPCCCREARATFVPDVGLLRSLTTNHPGAALRIQLATAQRRGYNRLPRRPEPAGCACRSGQVGPANRPVAAATPRYQPGWRTGGRPRLAIESEPAASRLRTPSNRSPARFQPDLTGRPEPPETG